MSDQQKMYNRSISLKSIKEFLDSEGLKIESFKFIAESYKSSVYRMSGVSMRFGELMLRIGPEEGAKSIQEPSMQALDLAGINPAAVYSLCIDWMKSKLRTKGLVFLVDDVLIRIGPMKDPLIIAPKRTAVEPSLEE